MSTLIAPTDRMKNEVHAEYHASIEATVAKRNPVDLGIVPFYEAYKSALSKEQTALLTIRKSTITPDITAADELRDMLFSGFVLALRSGACHYDETHRVAAASVLSLLSHYGNIAARTLDAETAALNDMFTALAAGVYPAQLETLGLSEWVAKLHEANDSFTSLMAARYEERASRPNINMRTARPATDRAYRALATALNIMDEHSPSEALTALINELTAIADRYRTIVERSKKGEAETQANETEANGMKEG